MNNFLASNLRLLRKQLGVPGHVVADALNVGRSVLSGWENARSEPPFEYLLALADYYRVSLDRLFRQDMRTLGQYHLGVVRRGYDKTVFKNGILEPQHPPMK